MSRNEHFNSGSGNHDQECYSCGSTGNSNHYGMGNDKKCPYCGSGSVYYTRSLEEQQANRGDVIDKLTKAGHGLNDIKVDDSGQPHVEYKVGEWLGKYKGGGIDISHTSDPNRAIHFINLNDYAKDSPETISPQDLHEHMTTWAEEDGKDFLESL